LPLPAATGFDGAPADPKYNVPSLIPVANPSDPAAPLSTTARFTGSIQPANWRGELCAKGGQMGGPAPM